ncbi:hypothetical protein [Streptomyces sp. cg35]|uniref:hypothetical protein n=1 Tax=Streptomyces sp. cg35 TaxID=3421650 RepID=UPI003D17E824
MSDAARRDQADWDEDESTHEPMRPPAGARRNPSREDRSVRRRMRRSSAQEENSMPSPDRSTLLQQIASARTVQDQMVLVKQLDELDLSMQRQAALDREVDLSRTSIEAAMTPVLSATAGGTMETDWLLQVPDNALDQSQLVAQAAVWYQQVPEYVRADAEEFTEQARGRARVLASGLGAQASAAEAIFVDYTSFLRTQSASGLDQIQQTTAPDGVTQKPTPIDPTTFDNFAPEVNDLNVGVVGTETSDRAPAIQQAVNGGGNSSPEVPGGHQESGTLTGPAPEPSLGGGGASSAPEQPGGHSESGAVPSQGGPQQAPAAEPAQPETEQTQQAPDFEQKAKTAASGLEQIQQTTDVNNQPHATPLPTTVAFPWQLDEGVEADGMTGDAHYDQGGQVSSGHQSHASLQTQADQWSQPHQFAQPNIANSPATTPPRTPADAGSGAADARSPEAQPSFGDAHAASTYTDSYTSAAPAAPAQNVPVSMGGDNGQAQQQPKFASRKIATREEMQHPDFQRGYKYASKWQPSTPVVRPGTPELEAGIYAGLTDHPQHRQAWLTRHSALVESEPGLGQRIATHRQFTHKVAAEHGLPTDGTYLSVQAATGIDLDTTNPSTSPAPSGDTPINGPGRPGPLAGQQDAAAPAGPSPYNGAAPFGSPVVPSSPSVPQGQPVHIPDSGMAAAPAGSGLSPAAAAFRRTVQANKLQGGRP